MLRKLFGLTSNPKSFQFRCSDCGEMHKGSPSFGYDTPFLYSTVPEEERADRAHLTSDICSIDDDTFFIRGVIEIPIHDVEDPLLWGVWVSQSQESFERYVASFDGDQSDDGSFGWLDVTMQGYDLTKDDEECETLGCDVSWQGFGARPLIVPQECDHILYRDCTNGISWDRAIELARLVMHG